MPPPNESEWFVYILRCRDGSLYTGITTDVQRRIAEHEAGKGAKYLRGKAPLQLVFQQRIGSRSEALKVEAGIKKLDRAGKDALMRSSSPEPTASQK